VRVFYYTILGLIYQALDKIFLILGELWKKIEG